MPKSMEQKRREAQWRNIRTELVRNHYCGSSEELRAKQARFGPQDSESIRCADLLVEREQLWEAFAALPQAFRDTAMREQNLDVLPELRGKLDELKALEKHARLENSFSQAAAVSTRSPRF